MRHTALLRQGSTALLHTSYMPSRQWMTQTCSRGLRPGGDNVQNARHGQGIPQALVAVSKLTVRRYTSGTMIETVTGCTVPLHMPSMSSCQPQQRSSPLNMPHMVCCRLVSNGQLSKRRTTSLQPLTSI